MVNSFSMAVVAGTILGILAGLGIGGGSLLVLWLTLVVGMPQGTARMTNLLFFIFAGGTVSLFRWKKGQINLQTIFPAILTGCCAAAIFSCISANLDMDKLKKLFAILLLITGVREVFYRPRNAK